MKVEKTKKSINKDHKQIYGTGFLQYLLMGLKPDSYCASSNGWDCDNYLTNDIVISSGYRPIRTKGLTNLTLEKQQYYENKARTIMSLDKQPMEERKQKVNALLYQFIEELKA